MRVQNIFRLMAAVVLSMVILPAYGQSAGPDVASNAAQNVSADLTGTWVFDVELAVSAPFTAMQTFHLGGTLDETTDLLAGLGEGPGHGAWKRNANGEFTATFELFIFEPDHTPAGRIRVRESLRIDSEDALTGYTVADLILPDGTVIENIDNGPVVGRRVRVSGVRPEEVGSTPIATSKRPLECAW